MVVVEDELRGDGATDPAALQAALAAGVASAFGATTDGVVASTPPAAVMVPPRYVIETAPPSPPSGPGTAEEQKEEEEEEVPTIVIEGAVALTAGVIAGIVIGACAVCCIGCIVMALCVRKRGGLDEKSMGGSVRKMYGTMKNINVSKTQLGVSNSV